MLKLVFCGYKRPLVGLICAGLTAPSVAAENAVTLHLQGRIAPQCAIAAPSDVRIEDASIAGALNIPVQLTCNAPFTITITSRQGSMIHTTINSPVASFRNRFPYTVGFSISGTHVLPLDKCRSHIMQSGSRCLAASGPLLGKSQNILSINWDNKSLNLMAGTYTDRLTIVVQSRL